MKVAILAGGLGTRLKEYYPTTIKSLIRFGGFPFIYHQLLLLKRNLISDVVICTGNGSTELLQYLATDKNLIDLGMNIKVSYDGVTPLGTGGAIKKALPLLDKKFMVLYGDSYLDFNYQGVIKKFEYSGKLALMTIYNNRGKYDKGNVLFDGSEILYYGKDSIDELDYIDYGANLFSKEAFHDTPLHFNLSLLQERLVYRREMDFWVALERFYEIGSIEGIEEFNTKLMKELL